MYESDYPSIRFLSLDIEDKIFDSPAYAFPVNSELKEFFDYKMIWFHQTGINVSFPITRPQVQIA